jgi:hypothetical protein
MGEWISPGEPIHSDTCVPILGTCGGSCDATGPRSLAASLSRRVGSGGRLDAPRSPRRTSMKTAAARIGMWDLANRAGVINSLQPRNRRADAGKNGHFQTSVQALDWDLLQR